MNNLCSMLVRAYQADLTCPFHGVASASCLIRTSGRAGEVSFGSLRQNSAYMITAGRRLQDWEGQGPLLSPARVFPWVVGTLVIQQVLAALCVFDVEKEQVRANHWQDVRGFQDLLLVTGNLCHLLHVAPIALSSYR